MANLATNLPVLKTPYLDTNGQITQPWLMFLVQLYQRTGGNQTPPLNLTEVQQTYLNAVNILSSNGFAGLTTYTTNTANIELSTTITGITKGNGTALSAAVSGTDYSLPVLVSSTNGFAGTVSNGLSNATITMQTTITGLLKGNGTAISAAVSGVDYAPPTSGTSILYGDGFGGFSDVTIGSGVSFTGGTLSATGSGGTVTSVAASGGTTGLTFSGSPIITSGTITLSGTLGTGHGGTNLTTYTTGDILYASDTNTLSKLAVGTTGYTLTVASGVPVWKPPYVRTSFTATASQTTFSATYNVGYVQVFVNGVLLNNADYTATNGTSIVLGVGCNAGDIVETIAYNV